MVLEDYIDNRNNNLNIIRFIAAILVIYSHSFPLTGNGSDYLNRITNGQIGFGSTAVSIFFFYGGFLICKSMMAKEKAFPFFKARVIRIFPPLILVVFVSAFVLGPFFTSLSAGEYFTNINTYKYLLNSVFVLVHNLPGVFENSPYNPTVNGPLWTLPVEFLCYIMCYFLYRLRLLDRKKIIVLSIFIVVLYAFLWNYFNEESFIRSAMRPAMMFYCGIVCFIFKDKIPIKNIYAVISILLCIVSCVLGIINATIFIFFAYALLWTAFGIKKFGKFGSKYEISYGIYLVGWPIQQILNELTNNNISQMYNFLIAATISCGFGFLISIFDKKISRIFVKKIKE